MFPAVRAGMLGLGRSLRGLARTPTPTSTTSLRQHGWWLPPGRGGLPPGLTSRWIPPDTLELIVDMGRGSGGVKYDTKVSQKGEIAITARWDSGEVYHLRYSLPPQMDPTSVKTTLGEDGVVKITARHKQ